MLSNSEKLLNKKIMATLQELNSKLQEIKGNLSTYESQKEEALKGLRSTKATLKDLGKEIRELENKIGAFETVISTQTDEDKKAELEAQRDALIAEKTAKETQRDEIIELGKARNDAESRIEQANLEIQGIIDEFASDPRINQHLQEAIAIKYDEQIEQKEQEKTEKIKLAEKFSLDLQNDKVFGTLVSQVVKSYAEVKNLPTFAVDAESKKRASTIRGTFTRNVNKLRAAIAARPEYADLILTEDDFETIVAGPNSEGKYVMPSFEESISTIEKSTKDIAERRDKTVDRIKSALVREKVNQAEEERLNGIIEAEDRNITDAEAKEKAQDAEIARLEKEIKDLRAGFSSTDTSAEEKDLNDAKAKSAKIDGDIKSKKSEITNIDNAIATIDTQIAAVGFDKAKLDALEAKAGLPAKLKDDNAKAQKEYDDALKALKDKGYINKKVYPKLESPECQTAYKAFKDADLEVRKAFLKCQTENSDAAKKELKDAMDKYTKTSDALLKVKGMEGLTVENWHDYLVREVNREARDGEVDEVYYDGVLKSRLDSVRETYKNIPETDTEFENVENAANEISKLQEEFLKGKKVDFDKDVETKLANYENSMTALFNQLKAKGAKGLDSIGKLFEKLGAQISTSRFGKFFSGIMNFFKFNKKSEARIISGVKPDSERKANGDLMRALKTKEIALNDSKDAVQKHIQTKLSKDELNELKSQEEKKAKAAELVSKKSVKEAEKAQLGVDLAGLTTDKTAAEAEVAKKQQVLDDAKKKGTATPAQQAQLRDLNTKKSTAEAEKVKAQNDKKAAEKAKSDAQQAKQNLKPIRPTEVVRNSKAIAHGKGQELTSAALNYFDKDDER